ncbi:hypothetical protein [Capnocytophaga leadbetteri]|uniref:hypothetical protein n=1 Tax=Capnocytophaga leadbetteri TaxID=327575 RepID=UPI00205564E8|nr:hypothetical protein [Capnocytophaga leadbetteri]DAO91924.1 MAG TPA: hypothetical protein [Caudoviricetes sp.]
MKTENKTFRVTYTKYIGGNGTIIVKAKDETQAIANAKYLCATGKYFREPQQVDDNLYKKPRKQGFQGRQ